MRLYFSLLRSICFHVIRVCIQYQFEFEKNLVWDRIEIFVEWLKSIAMSLLIIVQIKKRTSIENPPVQKMSPPRIEHFTTPIQNGRSTTQPVYLRVGRKICLLKQSKFL